MTQKIDLRTQRTLTNIHNAFLELVIEIGFANLSVKALSERAMINRVTFYRHYKDKYDLAEQLLDVLFQYEPNPELEPLAQMTEVFEHIGRYADFYFAAVSGDGIPQFQERLLRETEHALRAQVAMYGYTDDSARMPPVVVIRYLAVAQTGFVKWWLENKQPFPPAQAAEFLLQLHVEGGSWALGKG